MRWSLGTHLRNNLKTVCRAAKPQNQHEIHYHAGSHMSRASIFLRSRRGLANTAWSMRLTAIKRTEEIPKLSGAKAAADERRAFAAGPPRELLCTSVRLDRRARARNAPFFQQAKLQLIQALLQRAARPSARMRNVFFLQIFSCKYDPRERKSHVCGKNN